MSLTRLPVELRRRAACQCALASIPQRRQASSSPLFALAALSNSRETQHFNKATKLSRVEHSPALKLIQTSEVDPFASNKQPAKREASSVSTPPPAGEKEGIDHEALASLPVAARREIWYTWYQSDRSRSLSELSREWREKQRVAGSSAAVGDGATAFRYVVGTAASSGGSDMGDGKSPSESGESAVEKEDGIDESQEASKVGRAYMSPKVEQNRELQQKLKEMQSENRQLKKDVREAEAKAEQASSWGVFFFGLACFGGMGYGLYKLIENANPSKLKRTVVSLERELKQTREVAQSEGEKLRAQNDNQLEQLRRERHTLLLQAREEIAESKAVIEEQMTKNSAHEAVMADWAQKAEALKRAVERKDVRDLSKSEINAYLEALVFLGVKDRPQKRWWKGLFWKQE